MEFTDALRWVVQSAATSYGYTLTIWSTTAVLLHHRGVPTEAGAISFVAGAIGGFAVVGAIANRGRLGRLHQPRPRTFRIWQALHLAAVAIAILCAAVISRGVDGWPAWPLSGFTATTAYFTVLALQLSWERTTLEPPAG